MTDKDQGFDAEDRLVVDVNGRSVETLRSELAQASAVEAVTMTSAHPDGRFRKSARRIPRRRS
jgi:hypothetical protein